MLFLPWRGRDDEDGGHGTDDRYGDDDDGGHGTDDRYGDDDDGGHGTDSDTDPPAHSCEFQDGTLSVFEDRIHIDRSSRSKFPDKSIAINQVREVTYERRFVISYIQIEQQDFDTDTGSLLSTPVDENTLHFGRGKRDCARRARDAIVERMTGN